MLAVMLAAGMPGKAAAAAVLPAEADAGKMQPELLEKERTAEGTGTQTGENGRTETDTADVRTPSGPEEDVPEKKDLPDGFQMVMDSYELYPRGDTSNTLDVLRKGRDVRVVVHMKVKGLLTGDVGKSNVAVTKQGDSFKMSGAPSVKVISDKEDELEYTVTFPNLTYLGKGNSLKFRTSFRKTGLPSQVQEVRIEECAESSSGKKEHSDDMNGQPVIRINRVAPETPVAPGEAFTLSLELENTSTDSDIEDMVVSVVPGTSLFIGDDTNSRIVGRLDCRKSAIVHLGMIAGKELSGPTQVIDLELKFNYYSGGNLTAGSSSQKVLIGVKNGASAGQPVIRVGRLGPDRPVGAGEAFHMTVTLQNTSQDKDIRSLSAVFETNDQIALMEETDTKQLGDLKAGESLEIPVSLKTSPDLAAAASQMLGMTLRFEYDSDKGAVQGTYSEKLVIPTGAGGKGPGSPTPNIIIKNYTYGEKVTAGQVFDLELEFANTSRTSAVENVVMSLETGEGISINSASNTFYIPQMGPGESRREKVQMQALFQSKLQSPKITISCKYEFVDRQERKQSSSSEIIAIPVYQPDRLQIGTPSFSEIFRQGEEATISIPYVNKGRGQVYNVEATLDGDIDALAREVNLGNFEPGKSGTIDFVVTPREAGQFSGKVLVAYEDETADVKQMEIPVTFDVEEPMDGLDEIPEDFDPVSQEKGFPIPWIAAAAGAVLLVTPAAVRIRRRKKSGSRPEEESWDEPDDMEDLNDMDEPEDTENMDGMEDMDGSGDAEAEFGAEKEDGR